MRKIVSLLTFVLLFTIAGWSQGKVSGTVKDQNGDIVPFATINVKGTKVTVAADANANFSIPAKIGDVLVISAIGAQTTEVTVNDRTVSAVITRTAGSISDVVVTTAAGTKVSKREQGFVSTVVTAKSLTQAKPTVLASALAGRAAGVQVMATGGGVNPNFRIIIRGQRSLTGNNQPLLILDGNIVTYDLLTNISPEDIDNINIYGVIVPARLKAQGYLIYPSPFRQQFIIRNYEEPVSFVRNNPCRLFGRRRQSRGQCSHQTKHCGHLRRRRRLWRPRLLRCDSGQDAECGSPRGGRRPVHERVCHSRNLHALAVCQRLQP